MTAPTPYLHLAGTAREALRFYAGVFGGDVELHTLADFGRDDGPADAIAHGTLTGGAVNLYAADATGDQVAFHSDGLMFSLLGAAAPDTLHRWFDGLAVGGEIVDDLQLRPWGAADGQVRDRFGLLWLIGYEVADAD